MAEPIAGDSNSSQKAIDVESVPVQGSLTELNSASHLHLALAQVLPSEEEDGEVNGVHQGGGDFAKLEAYARRAAQEGADVVAFPEYFLTGASHDSWYRVRDQGGPTPHSSSSRSQARLHSREEQESEEKHWLDDIGKLATELDINIVAGTVVEMGHAHQAADSAGEQKGKLFNTAYFVGREGKVKGTYTKRNLWHPERKPLTAASADTHPPPSLFTFTTRRGRTLTAGMQICWDLAFPESFRALLQPPATSATGETARIGPDVIFAPTCWYATDGGPHGMTWNPFGEAGLLDSLALTRALECESILAMINVAGKPFPQDFKERYGKASLQEKRRLAQEMTDPDAEPIGVGRTTIVAPFLGSIGRLDGPEEALLLGSIDLKILPDIRETYKIREDLPDM